VSDEPAVEAPPPTSKVEITVAGHTVAVEGPEQTEHLAALALRLYRETADDARLMPMGFSAQPADLQIAPSWEPPRLDEDECF
jgi:hypothetical protein